MRAFPIAMNIKIWASLMSRFYDAIFFPARAKMC
jgi:hypothetical protein